MGKKTQKWKLEIKRWFEMMTEQEESKWIEKEICFFPKKLYKRKCVSQSTESKESYAWISYKAGNS
jgi:hypothetical protein